MKRGRRTTVAKATKAVKAEEETPVEPDVPTTLFITGLQRPWNDDELREKLSQLTGAELTEYRVNSSRSQVIVTLSNATAANRAVEELNNKPINDKPASQPITVTIAEPGQEFTAVLEVESTNSTVPITSQEETNSSMDVTTAKAELPSPNHDEMLRKGYRVTTTQPPLYFLPRSEDKIQYIRKRRNYELDSTTLTARFYANRGHRKKRSHYEMDDRQEGDGAGRFEGRRSEGGRFDRPPRYHDRRDGYHPRG